MRKDEKNGSTGRTICTRSLASASTEQETPALRRSTRGTPSTPAKLIAPNSSTRKSERLAPSPASVTKKSGRVEKKTTPSPLQKSDKGKVVSSENSKGSDNSGKNADTSSDIEVSKDKKINNTEDPTNKIKKHESTMTGRSYRALFREILRKELNTSSNDEELVVVGCSRRVPAGNDDARDDNRSPHANLESKMVVVDETSLQKGTDFPVKLIRDTENMVLDASPMVKTGDDSAIASPSESSETQKLFVSKTSLETDIDLPLKRKWGTAGIVLDACATVANADDRVMCSDGVIPSPSVCKNDIQSGRCSTCEKRQKVKDDFESLSVCSCISQPVQESDQVAQDTKEFGPATSRDFGENRQNIQQDKSYDPKLIYPEYWVPVQLSNVQVEQYCRILFSKSLTLASLSKNDLVGALEETLTSVRKTCDHPYVMDASLKQLLTKNLELHEILDVEVKASGKLHLLDSMLTQIKTNGLKAVVFYQATQNSEGLLLANILEDFVSQRFGQNSYEHGVSVSLATKNAVNNFNKESQCFVLLLETRACSQSIKLLRAEALILFGSSLNPSHDVKLLEKIKIESYSERTKIFRLYSTYTVEEKALILARQNKWQNKPLENLNRPLTHALLMWGASYLFEKLDHFHGSETPYSGVPFEQAIKDGVIHEFSSVLSSIVGERNEGKLCLLLEAKHAQGTYITDSTLFGEEHAKLSNKDSPNIFWTKLLGGKNPMWKYCSDTRQRSRKRVQYLQGSEEIAKIGNSRNIKKQKKASADGTVNNDEIKASGKNHMGALESPKVTTLESSRRSASGTNDTLNRNDAFGLYSVGSHISGIPEDMLAGIDWRQFPGVSQSSLHAVLKPEMAKLCQVLHLSEDSTSMVEKFLDYVIENHRVCIEPATTLQAFQIALSWIAVLLVEQKLNRKESVVRAKSELAFKCCKEEVDYIYSMLYCMKSLFLKRTQGATVSQERNNTKLMRNSEGEECMTEKRGGHNSSATKDIEKAISYIKKKCKKRLQNLKEKHVEKRLERVNMYADKKQKLENEKKVESAIIRIQCRWTSTQSLEDGLKRLDHDHERKIDNITTERDAGLKSLEQMHEAEKKKLAEDEAYWISRVKKWAHADLINCGPIKGGSNKHFSAICSSNPSKNDRDVQTCNDANGEATYADTNGMVSKENQVPEVENTLGTLLGGSTQEVHEMLASKNDKAMDVLTLSGEQPTDNVATKSQSIELASITAAEILIPAGGQEEFAALNEQLSEYQICDRMISATPNEDVPSMVPEISKSFANLAKSASQEFSVNREEALVTIENNRTSHVAPDSDYILDQQNEEACSLDKEVPDELALPVPHPASMVETRGSPQSDQDDQDICPMPSSPGGKQSDPAANFHVQNIESAIEPQSAGSLMPSSPGGRQPGPEANIQGKNIEAEIEPQPAGSPMPSSPTEKQPGLEADIQGQNIDAAIEPQPAESETIETGVLATLEQGDQFACPLPSSPAGNLPDSAANIQDQNINTLAEPHMGVGDSAVSDQEIMAGQDACSLSSPLVGTLVGTQGNLAANIESQNITPVTQLHTGGTDAVEAGGSPVSDQGAQDAFGNRPSAAVNIEGLNNTTVADPHTGGSDTSELEIAEPGPQVEELNSAYNVAQHVHQGSVEPSAGVTAPVPSPLTSATVQSTIQPVPHTPFPVFNDPFQHELEKLRRESENSKKTYDEKKSVLKAELERKMAEIQAEYQRKFHEVEAEHTARMTKMETSKNHVLMNKLLASAFLSKCTNRNGSHPSVAPTGRVQQLAQRAALLSTLRNYTAPAPAPNPTPTPTPLLPQTQAPTSFPSSASRLSGLHLNSAQCPIPQARQPLTSNTAPSLSATNPAFNAKLRSPAPHVNPYRSSSSIPIPTTTPSSSPLPQAVTFSTVLLQQQQQQPNNLGSGLQTNNGVVCLSDDE